MQAVVRGLSISTTCSKTFSSASADLCRYPHYSKSRGNISNAIYGRSNTSRGSSFVAASLPSHHHSTHSSSSSKPQSIKAAREARKAMVKAFVDKYRALNAGKYPTPSAAKKQVGGSYYTVKNILEELVYNNKMSPMTSKINETPLENEVPKEECPPSLETRDVPSSTTNEILLEKKVPKEECLPSPETREVPSSTTNEILLEKEVPKEECLSFMQAGDVPSSTTNKSPLESKVPRENCLPSPEAKTIPSSTTRADFTYSTQNLDHKVESQTVVINNMNMDEATSNRFEAQEETLSSIEMPCSEDVLNPKTTGDPSDTDISRLSLEEQEKSEKKAATSYGSLDLNEPKIVQEADQEILESDKLDRDIFKKENEEQQWPNRSTVWGNLRSFADGIMNFWKKL